MRALLHLGLRQVAGDPAVLGPLLAPRLVDPALVDPSIGDPSISEGGEPSISDGGEDDPGVGAPTCASPFGGE